MVHTSTCSCGQLSLHYEGELPSPSICHCYACQKRTGSVFGTQTRLPAKRVKIDGKSSVYLYTGDEGGKASMHFCPHCGSTVYWIFQEESPEWIIAAVGGFANRDFPAPIVSVYGKTRKHAWVALPYTIEKHWD